MLLFGVEAGDGQVDPLRLIDQGAEVFQLGQGLAVLLLQQVHVHQRDAGALVVILAGDDVPVERPGLIVALRLDEQLTQLHLQLARPVAGQRLAVVIGCLVRAPDLLVEAGHEHMSRVGSRVEGEHTTEHRPGLVRLFVAQIHLGEQQQDGRVVRIAVADQLVLVHGPVVLPLPAKHLGIEHAHTGAVRVFLQVAVEPLGRLLGAFQAEQQQGDLFADIGGPGVTDQGVLVGLERLLEAQQQFGVASPEKVEIGTAVVCVTVHHGRGRWRHGGNRRFRRRLAGRHKQPHQGKEGEKTEGGREG